MPAYLAAGAAERVRRVNTGVPRRAGRAARAVTPPPTRSWRSGPRRSGDGLGKDFALLSGFLDYKAEFYADADRRSSSRWPTTPPTCARRPELLYYLGRSYYANANYTKAVDALERFVRSADRARPRASSPKVRDSFVL